MKKREFNKHMKSICTGKFLDIKKIPIIVTGGENPTVYIGEGEQLGYLSQEVRDELGW